MEPSSRTIYLRLLRHVVPYSRAFALSIAAMVVLAATEPAVPALLKPTLDGSFVEKDIGAVTTMSLLLVLVFFVRGVSSFVSAVSLSWVAGKVVMDMRTLMFDRLVTLPSAFFDHSASGTIISKVTFDATQVTDAASSVITVMVRDSLAIVGLLAWMIWLDWNLSLVALVTAPVVVLVVKYFSKRLRRMSQRLQESMGDVTHVVEEVVAGQKVVRSFGAEAQERTRFVGTVNAARRFKQKFEVAAAANAPIAQFVTAIALAVILWLAARQSAAGELTVGSFVSFFAAMAMLFSPLKRLTGVNARLQRGIAAAASVFALVDEIPESDTGTRRLERAEGRIEFRGVSFRYAGTDERALVNVDVEVAPGETVALVGPSGAGKTTIANLIPRFYDVDSGAVLIDGRDVRDYTLASLRQNVALVSQEVVLFNGTIAENIAYGPLADSSREEIEHAAEAANAMQFIRDLPKQLDTEVGERGVRLSGGERQRLAIARAFLKDAPVLILDEATSSLDNVSERYVQDALERLRRGRTTIVIAHRLSSIEHADRIAVIAEGRIVDIGTHAALLEKNSLYAGLYRFHFARQPSEAPAAGARP